MTQLQTRYPCPVCLGAMLQKSVIVEAPQLMIDHCVRCGGVWFDFGEVAQMRRCEPKVLWELVAEHTHVHQMQCHQCAAHLTRDEIACAGCGHANHLDCPKCGEPLAPAHYNGLRLDTCTRCRGVWFDRHELEAIWRIELSAALQRRSKLHAAGHAANEAPIALLDALTWDPWITYYGVHAISHVGEGAIQAFGSAPELAAGAGDVVAEAATSVFETIIEIIGGFFG